MSPVPAHRYQPDHASAKMAAGGLLSVLGLAGLAALIAFGMYLAFSRVIERPPATALERTPIAPQGPTLETDPLKDRLALEARARARIGSYGWADRGKGLARIPIERAMALQAEKGWPDAEAPRP